MQETLEAADMEKLVDENKVDWKGRRADKLKYGGMRAAVLILGE